METSLSLTKSSLLQLDPISHKHTLRLLPLGKNNRQKIVVGDDSGLLYSYDFHKGEPIPVFSTKVFEGPISCVALGGATPSRPDKIFVGHRQQLSGISKKGKEFFSLSSSLSENISTIWVENTLIWTGCESICNQYDSGKDIAFFMSRGEINCMVVDYIAHADVFDCILGCEDNVIRFMQGDNLTMEILVPSAITSLAAKRRVLKGDEHTKPLLFYGREGGDLTCLEFTANQYDATGRKAKASESEYAEGDYRECWTISDNKTDKSSVTCMKIFDLTGDGREELLVAREDGRVEVYAQPGDQPSGLNACQPQLVFSHDIGEKIQSLEAGKVNSTAFNEIIVASYSGKVISFTAEELSKDAPEGFVAGASNMLGNSNVAPRPIGDINNDNRIKAIHKEIEALIDKIEKTRGKVKKLESDTSSSGLPSFGSTFSSLSSSTSTRSSSTIAHAAEFSSISKFSLDRELGVYILNVEIQCPLDVVILRSPANLEAIDVGISTNLVSVTPAHLLAPYEDDTDACRFMAALRARTGEKRTRLALRPREGEHGDIHLTIVTSTTPKMAKSLRLSLKPLSLHALCHSVSKEEMELPRCSISFKGDFSINVAFEWVQLILPDVASNLGTDTSKEIMYFKNCYSGAIAKCHLESNAIIFESQSPSTVAIFKEAITRHANFRRIALSESTDAIPEAIEGYISLFQDNLAYQLSLARKVAIVDAVKEVALSEMGSSEGPIPAWISEEMREVYRDSERITKEYKEKAQVLEYICGMIVGAHVDYYRLLGLASKTNPTAVRDAVMSDASFEQLKRLVIGEAGTEAHAGHVGARTSRRRSSAQWQPPEDHKELGEEAGIM